MDNLHIEKTKYTMGINFDKDTGILEMSGSSYPENALEFFGPIIQWIRDYSSQFNKNIDLNIRLNYLNTSSTKCILDIFEMLDQYHKSGGHVKINWHYAKNDEDIMETGEELAEDFEFPIAFVSY
jgi:SiaC family regulatory phosphoprotein